jgi:hypothetical protein
MIWRWRTAYTWICVFLAVFITPVLLYIGYFLWDMHRVQQICAQLRPGSPVADIRRIVSHYGLSQYLMDDGLYDKKTKTWDIFIPTGTTLGDLTCAIEHNRTVVVRTVVLDDR